MCEDVTGATCMTSNRHRLVSCDGAHQKTSNQAWFTARVFARIFPKHGQCDVSEVMDSARRVHFETLRLARIRLDAAASLVWRQWWREILASSISSPQSRGEEMFASSFEILGPALAVVEMPVLSLERLMLDARGKDTRFAFSNLPLGGSVGRGNDSFLFQS